MKIKSTLNFILFSLYLFVGPSVGFRVGPSVGWGVGLFVGGMDGDELGLWRKREGSGLEDREINEMSVR